MQVPVALSAAFYVRWLALALAAVLSTACAAGSTPATTSISAPLQRAMHRVAPNGRILRASEIDMRECEAVPRTPGLLKADFNGDGFEDAAALIVTGISNQPFTSEGVTYRRASLLFAIFLNDGKGGYSTPTADKYRNLIPAMMFVDLIPAERRIRNIEADKEVVLANPAVMLTFCGKSAAAYTVSGTRVEEIPLSD